MAKSRSNKRKTRALNTLQEKGMGLCALGLGMLILPFFMDKSLLLGSLAGALRPVGGLALTGGLVLLALHHITRTKVEQANPLPHPSPRAPTTTEREATAAPMRQAASSWSPAVFAAIEWRRFEAVCETLFGQAGFETKSQSHGADGGVDIWLHSRNAEGPVAVVQCKHWQGKAVGVKELREFFGVMASHKLTHGTYATTSTYTTDAQQFAKDNGINALDGKGLLALIAKRTPEQQQKLLDVAYEGEYWRPTCASCGVKLVERTPTQGGAQFWGCSNYPRCKSRLPMVAALR